MDKLGQRILDKLATEIFSKEYSKTSLLTWKNLQLLRRLYDTDEVERAVDLALEELQDYKSFYDHIKKHFEKEHPDWEVMCKICNKTFKQIVEEKRLLFKPKAKKEGE